MKATFVIQQKMKVAILMSVIMILLILNSFLSKMNIEGVDKSVNSIYHDRLIPAIELVQLTESIYEKHLLLTNNKLSQSHTSLVHKLAVHNSKIDSLLKAYEKTFLVDTETSSLNNLKTEILAYQNLEKTILALYHQNLLEQAKETLASKGEAIFQDTLSSLRELTTIQSQVGEELRKASKQEVAQYNLHSSLQIIISIVLGLLIINLIFSAKIITHKPQKFNLN